MATKKPRLPEDIRQRRLELQRQIADLFQEQNRFYAEMIRPNSHAAKLYRAAIRTGEAPLDIEVANKLALGPLESDTSEQQLQTRRFEHGRAMVADISTKIRRLRNELKKIEDEIGKPSGPKPPPDLALQLRRYANETLGRKEVR